MKDENGYSIHEFKTEGVVLKNPTLNIEVDPALLKAVKKVVREGDEIWGDYNTSEVLEKLIVHKQKDKTMSEMTPLQNFEIWLLKDGFTLEAPGLLNAYDCNRSYKKDDRLIVLGCGLTIVRGSFEQRFNFYIRECSTRSFYNLDNSREYYEKFMDGTLIPIVII